MSFYPLIRVYPFSAAPPSIVADLSATASASVPLFQIKLPVGTQKFSIYGETHEGWTGPTAQPDSTFGFANWPQQIQTWMVPSLLSSAASGVPNGTDTSATCMGISLGGTSTYPFGAANNEAYVALRARFGTTPFWEVAFNRGGGGGSTTEVTARINHPLIAAPAHRRLSRLSLAWEPNLGVNSRIRAWIDGVQATSILTASGSAPDFTRGGSSQIRGLCFFVSNSADVNAQTQATWYGASIQAFPSGTPNAGTIP